MTFQASLDRDALRAAARRWSDTQRRILVERVLERLPDADLERLLPGLARLDVLRADAQPPLLGDRVAAHAAATRRGEFLGELIIRNKHGQREPWQTASWVAVTSHLFELARERSNGSALRELTALVREVDERTDSLVVFEDVSAADLFGRELQDAASFLK